VYLFPSREKNFETEVHCKKCGGETVQRDGHGVQTFECVLCQFVRIVRLGSARDEEVAPSN
jgi:ribosomal protein L37AE/L43A